MTRTILTTRFLVSIVVLLAFVAMSGSASFAADMFSGTWKLNIAKSQLPGPPPKEPTVQKLRLDGNGVKLVGNGVSVTGHKAHQEFAATFDGKEYLFVSTTDGKPSPAGSAMVSAKKIDDYTIEFAFTRNGSVYSRNTNVISKDGKTRTVTQVGTNPQGQTTARVLVYDKQ